MRDVFKHFEANGVTYPFCFNINVIEFIQDEFKTEEKDGLTNWGELIEPEGDGVPSMKALKAMMQAAINEGIDIENESKAEKREFVSLVQTGRILSSLGDGAMSFAKDAMKESNGNDQGKNLKTE